MNRRASLVQQFDQARRHLNESLAGKSLNHYRALAHSLIGSEKIGTALELAKEEPRLRATYGMTLFGHACLAARRLVEAGSRFVTVFWDEYGLAGSGWDTHWDHYPRMEGSCFRVWMTTGNTMAPCVVIVIGERAAEILKARHKL